MKNNRLVWVDIESTGIDENTNGLLEVAWVITDNDLNTIVEKSYIRKADWCPIRETILIEHHNYGGRYNKEYRMDKVVLKMHTKNGLLKDLATGRPRNEIEDEFVADIKEHTLVGNAPLAGNSVSFDRTFLKVHMPKIDEVTHYRNLDVSSLNIFAKRWYPEILKDLKKGRSHRALDDIRESVEELKFYRSRFFQCHEPNAETRAAIEDARTGKTKKMDKAFFETLDDDNINSI